MGLNLAIGMPADAPYADTTRIDLAVIGELLNGEWAEPLTAERQYFEVWGYSGLHRLRRIAVHLAAHAALPEPLGADERAIDDPLLAAAYAAAPADPPGPFDHLIYHSDAEGYYVPADFAAVITDERAPAGGVGSSIRLLAEAQRLAEALGLPADLDRASEEVIDAADDADVTAEGWRRYGIEAYICLTLIEAAALSVSTGAAISFV